VKLARLHPWSTTVQVTRSRSAARSSRRGTLGAILAGLALCVVVSSVAGAAAAASAPSSAPSPSAGASVPGGALTVFAAASLTDVLDDLEARWLSTHPGVPLTASFGASSVLASQIAEGAEVDVFLSADTARPAELAEAGLTVGQPMTFAGNSLVIVAPADDPVVSSATDIADPGVRIVAAQTGVPITKYADEAIARLAATTDDPEAFARAVAANTVSREDDVRAALAKVELGEADAAVVYSTDARSSERVRAVPFPDAAQVTATYAGVQVSGKPAAAAFMTWLVGPDAQAVLADAGFQPSEG
jgi:molybdate transport system substrate-binding protein